MPGEDGTERPEDRVGLIEDQCVVPDQATDGVGDGLQEAFEVGLRAEEAGHVGEDPERHVQVRLPEVLVLIDRLPEQGPAPLVGPRQWRH